MNIENIKENRERLNIELNDMVDHHAMEMEDLLDNHPSPYIDAWRSTFMAIEKEWGWNERTEYDDIYDDIYEDRKTQMNFIKQVNAGERLLGWSIAPWNWRYK